ncbi:MAG: hypothetical protein HY343_13135 [Lentisphaerae bacterium]|nr:hypothetical protein [Lentisphaerota bacterium]
MSPPGGPTSSKKLLHLRAARGPDDYQDWARELADRELPHLARIESPHWWRLAERTEFLAALLALEDRSV